MWKTRLVCTLIFLLVFLSGCRGKTDVPESAGLREVTEIKVVDIAAGEQFTVALTSDGTVWTWGENNAGQLGDGTKENRYIPAQIKGLFNVRSVAAGGAHTLILKDDGTVWSWGANRWGQLGDGTTSSSSTPVKVIGLEDIIAIDANAFNSIALKKDGTVWVWGSNMYDQLGNRDAEIGYAWQIEKLSDVISIGLGLGFCLAVEANGSVWAWGWNKDTYLAVESWESREETVINPAKVKGISDIVKATGFSGKVTALTKNNTVRTWGQVETPEPVKELTKVINIGQGYYHRFAIKKDGTLWTWGSNRYGQLGNGTLTSIYTPTKVKKISNITIVDGGQYHSVALDKDGNVWTWGSNEYGQLGDGTTEDRLLPIKVSFPNTTGK